MKSKDIDINQFEKIEDLYAFVDQNAFELERNRNITDLWVAYRNKSSDEGEKQKAQWEIDFSLFDVKGDKLFSQVYSSTETSERVKSYPNLNELQSEVIHYLTIRSEESSNPILKAKYNHLLWKCPNSIKHNKYAERAIENYIESIESYLDQFEEGHRKETPYQVGRLYETLLAVANSTKTELSPIKVLTKKLLFKSDFEFYTKHCRYPKN